MSTVTRCLGRVCVQTLAISASLSSVVHAQGLDVRLERLAALVERERVEQQIPGLALGVVVDGEVVLAAGMGTADLEADVPVGVDTVFPIGSATKSFTAVLVGQLEEQGLLRREAPVADFVPGAVLSHGVEPTLQDCLSHATGLARMNLLSGKPDVTLETILEHVQRAELQVPYRTAFNYSNINFALAGGAVAAVTDTTWDAALAARILRPLGMTRSVTTVAARRGLDDVAVGYDVPDDTRDTHRRSMVWDLAPIAAAGAIDSSVTDMLRWVRCLLAGGELDGRRIVERSTLEALWEGQVPLGPGMAYASGFFSGERDGHRIVYHGGNVPGFATQVLLLPDDHAGLVLLSNVMVHPLQEGIIGLALDCLFGELPPLDEPEAAWPDDLERFAGRYWFEQGQMVMTAQVKDGGLHLDVPGQTVYELLPPDADDKWFFALTDTIAVSFDQQGDAPATSMTMYQMGMEMRMPRRERGAAEDGLPGIDDLLAGMRAAVGDARSSMLAVGEMVFPLQGASGEYTLYVGADGRVHDHADFGELGVTRTVIDGDRGWVSTPSGWVEPLAGEALERMSRGLMGGALGTWWAAYDELVVVGSREHEGRQAYLVEGSGGASEDVDELLVADDGRLLEARTTLDAGAMGGLPVTTTYADWREVGGLPMAHEVVAEMAMMGRMEYRLDLVRQGATPKPEWFERPAELAER